MIRLRIDTWDAEYGSSFEADADDSAVAEVHVAEERPWQPVRPAASDGRVPRIGFIDGGRRIDARLFAEGDAAIAPALAGSWAVGIAWSGQPPSIGDIRTGRHLVVGCGLDHPGIAIEIGACRLVYGFLSVAGSAPADPILGLQNAMRRAEAELAEAVAAAADADLLILDGPLSYFETGVPVVGMIKRQLRSYLSHNQTPVLAALDLGERTPVFIIADQRLERYSWYARIGRRRPIDGVMTGIVRLESASAHGIAAAARLADLTACLLPRFATEIGRDPRAPQNLYPVARLESELHRRMGDGALIKRGLEQALWRLND